MTLYLPCQLLTYTSNQIKLIFSFKSLSVFKRPEKLDKEKCLTGKCPKIFRIKLVLCEVLIVN